MIRNTGRLHRMNLRLNKITGWPQGRRKKFPDFSRLFQRPKLTIP